MVVSSLPAPALAASQSALHAAIAESIPPTNGTELEPGEVVESPTDEEQVLSIEGGPRLDGDRTVFEDQTTFNVKHPLYSSWTLWFDSPSTKGKNGVPSTPTTGTVPPTPSASATQGWMDDIKKVISFDSVEEFWGLYNNIVPPAQLGGKANYYLFKEGIIPAWEDAANKDGGKWSIQMPRDKNKANINNMWMYTMLAAIGETFDPALTNASADANSPPPPPSLITGVIFSARPQFYRISIWTRLAPSNAETAKAQNTHSAEFGEVLRSRTETVGKHFKTAVLGYSEDQKLGGQLATEVEFQSHKESERKGAKGAKKWSV